MDYKYTKTEELANGLIHGVGLLLSIVGSTVLIVLACRHGTVWHVVSFSVFAVSLIVLYTASTLYHSLTRLTSGRLFKTLDHCSIFILIAGTYTPFMLVNLRGPWGWSIFGIVWMCALVGIILKGFFTGRFSKLSVATYIAMGWLAIVAIREIFVNVPPNSVILLVTGGLLYTFGVIFYAWKQVPYNHAIWHLFVLGGSIAHYLAILFTLPFK